MASQPHVTLDDPSGLQGNDANAFFQSNGYNAYDQDASFNPAFDYSSGHLNLAHSQTPTLDPTWQDVLHHQSATSNSSSATQSAYYGNNFNNQQTPLHQSPYPTSAVSESFPQNSFDPALIQNPAMDVAFVNPSSYASTISPHALQTTFPPFSSNPGPQSTYKNPEPAQKASQQQRGEFVVPKGQSDGRFLITTAEILTQATNAHRLHHFLHVGELPRDITITKSTIPAYYPRKSRNEIRRLLSTDSRLAAKLQKKPTKKSASNGAANKKQSRPIVVPGGRGSGDVKRRSSPSSGDNESSDDDSSDDSSDDETMVSPLPATRPTVALEAVKYDTIKALWCPTNRPAMADEIRAGLKGYWEVIQTIRDRWKSDVAAVKQAEETKKIHELPLLKERVQTQRQMLEAVLKTALEFGHPDILENLGQNLPFMLCLAVFLNDRAKESDQNGSLSQAVLELLSRCKTLTDGTLEKTNIGKLLPRFMKRGDEKIQALVKKIQDNAVAALKKRKEAAKTGVSGAPQSKDSKPSAEGSPKSANPITGIKRQRPNEGEIDQPQKKLAAEPVRTASIGSAGPAGTTKGSPTSNKKTPMSVAETKAATTTAAAAVKAKAQPAVVRPSGFFSGLQSAAKKPGTSNAAVAAAKAAGQATGTDKKPQASARPTPAPKSTFSWSETMANLNKPKEPEPSSKPEEALPPETEEEKKKRLRKEKRRSLRVSFKPEGSLIDIRYFTHDPDEELGHDENMVRDVGDVGSEGRMLKLHQDQMEIDDDEDDVGAPGPEPLKAYITPSLVDFSAIDQEQRSSNYEPFGGGTTKPNSPEKLIQEQREANTLMVFYAKPSDVPSTPKEPSEPYSGETKELINFGTPPPGVVERITAFEAGRNKPVANNSLASVDLAAIISKINGAAPAQQQPHAQTAAAAPTELEKIFAQFATQVPQTQPQPSHMQPQQIQTPNIQALLANINPQLPVEQPTNFSLPGAVPPNLQSILASLGSAQGQGQSQGQIAQMQGFPYLNQQQPQPQNQFPGQAQQQQQPQTSQDQQYPFENEERRRWREQGGDDADDDDNWNASSGPQGNSQAGGNQQQRKQQAQRGWKLDKKGNRVPPKFVVQCKYWKEGKCRKGADCTFLHE